ncbi:MAG TPA: hypothetical protein VJI12_01420 [archaeon]|nr:hypothetical protein [archaeon]
MHLDEAMKEEAERLEREIISIDIQLGRAQKKIVDLIELRRKTEHDLLALKNSFETQADETLREILSRRPVRI